MELKELAKVFRGLENFTSDDKTRLMFNHVHVISDTRIEASDGHKLIRLDTRASHGLTPGFYDTKQAAALCKAGVAPTPILAQKVQENGWTWPDMDMVIPPHREGPEAAGAPAVGLSLAYLGEIIDGLISVLGCWGFGRSAGATVRFGRTAVDPVRFDANAHGEATAVVVLMPMRL